MTDKTSWSLRAVGNPSPIEVAMMLLSLLSVIIVLVMTFGRLDTETYRLLFFIDTTICMIFMVNFFAGLLRSRNKLFYLRHHWIDFIASIPAIEALRIARVFQILRVIRLIRMSRSFLIPLIKQRKQATLASLLVAMVTILTFASIIILIVESGTEGANIQTAEQAIWWALVTISTVGYGDFYPVSTAGHIVGGIVIVSGVSFFGVISGYMASVFVAPDESERQERQDAHKAEIKSELELALARMEETQRQMEQNQAQMLAKIAELKQALEAQKN
ncbi:MULTISPECIES: ion transporter [Shewanella]|uniref:Ion transporter n=1 Tax=Shewanella xiamenensis TaxID=332186 RepID=A0A1E3V399_9GAMM|nr:MULTISPECIES: ion transporter [Shewanella]PZP32671.1 MAG: ion transporter [Shewanella oneidensis]KPN77056.1 ion transporter [Shewanella sp. Sh95]MBW0280279.1 ion transporter [Shewanella xiamenensis]MBW0296953.1 ion transporter [Shewanella xiamenensis]MCD8550703.1 ion transporter [Shewanella xiamenensis]